jgi:hypothetical protein
MIDVAIIIGSTRPGRKGEAVAGNHLGTLPSDPTNRAQKTTPSCPAAGPHPPRTTVGFDLLTTSEIYTDGLRGQPFAVRPPYRFDVGAIGCAEAIYRDLVGYCEAAYGDSSYELYAALRDLADLLKERGSLDYHAVYLRAHEVDDAVGPDAPSDPDNPMA